MHAIPEFLSSAGTTDFSGERLAYDSIAELVADRTPDHSVVCLRPAAVEAAARHLTSLFPGDVLYAVKCNPHPRVLQALYRGGVRHFDTASLAEVKLVRGLLGKKVAAYFNHPVKARAAIAEASGRHGVRHFVVDSEGELHKVAESASGHFEIAVRLATPPGEAVQHMSSKFGASPHDAAQLLRAAAAMGHPAGIAFHVGSQCRDPNDYARALGLAAQVRDLAGVPVGTINVGGGFPAWYLGDDVPPLEAFTDRIASGVREFGFQDSRLQCEPGRALVACGGSILTQVQLRKGRSLYINDGIFGNLCEMVYLKLRLPLRIHRAGGGGVPGPDSEFTLFGPTCDPVDVLPGVWALPEGIQEGDWIEFGQIGAYSSAIATNFNGFTSEAVVDVAEQPFWPGQRATGEHLRIA